MGPYYDLEKWKSIAATGYYRITYSALSDGRHIGFDDEDILDCCFQLDDNDFYKPMKAITAPDLWQDVYKITYESVRLYVKIQINDSGKAVVVSFKEDTSR